jgi:Na+/melibiose symporter-like transporter
MVNYDSDELKRSRTSLIFQAAFEWLIAILIQSTFLAEVAKGAGFTDSEIGVLNSVIALGCLFQVLSLFFRRGSVKKLLMIISVLNQICFMLLYVIPDTPISPQIKKIVFVVLIVFAYATLYMGNPKLSFWRYSLVEPTKRGRYNGWMQMVSLIMGTVFSYAMGAVVDHYKHIGQTNIAFRICAVTIFVLMVFHSITLIISVELPKEKEEKVNPFKNMLKLLINKKVLALMGVFIFYNIVQYSAMPFYSTYQIEELHMDHTTIQILTALLGGGVQMLVAFPLGWIADRTSFSKMMFLCFVSAFLRTFVVIFATPATGVICFALYNVFNSVIFIGALCALLNMTYDIMPEKDRADTYALCQSVGGVIGFLTTLVMSRLLSYIQQNGNTFMGINAYAQQVLSVISLIFTVMAMMYLYILFIRKEKKK